MGKRAQHSMVTVAGIALLIGFFLPWVDLGGIFGRHGISGASLVWNANGQFFDRAILLLCPVLGASLAAAGISRSRNAFLVSFGVGASILGYVVYSVASSFIRTTGVGLWLVLGAAVLAFATGVRGLKSTRVAAPAADLPKDSTSAD